ncbi:Mannose glucose-specific lectin [Musa troglodytarum]|uniref:Mannose glucose-specific lectin n=1 Tax=Musa troglodytarum TaxID=320322 RepID=A0A9E7HJ10_9LILI|nr:Mannose glucose-specific lectin [Musa troglodytarum]
MFNMRLTYRIISIKISAGEVVDGMDITITYYGKMKTRHYDGTGGTSHENGAIKVGAWGGNGGSAYDMGPAHRIISVTVFSGDVVDAVDVTFNYYGKTETRHYGGSGGNPHKIVLEEDEYLVGMEGEFASYHGVVVVGKLGFTTNKKAYGPFGNMGGTPFDIPIAAGKISGFFGRGGKFLDAIGVYLVP